MATGRHATTGRRVRCWKENRGSAERLPGARPDRRARPAGRPDARRPGGRCGAGGTAGWLAGPARGSAERPSRTAVLLRVGHVRGEQARPRGRPRPRRRPARAAPACQPGRLLHRVPGHGSGGVPGSRLARAERDQPGAGVRDDYRVRPRRAQGGLRGVGPDRVGRGRAARTEPRRHPAAAADQRASGVPQRIGRRRGWHAAGSPRPHPRRARPARRRRGPGLPGAEHAGPGAGRSGRRRAPRVGRADQPHRADRPERQRHRHQLAPEEVEMQGRARGVSPRHRPGGRPLHQQLLPLDARRRRLPRRPAALGLADPARAGRAGGVHRTGHAGGQGGHHSLPRGEDQERDPAGRDHVQAAVHRRLRHRGPGAQPAAGRAGLLRHAGLWPPGAGHARTVGHGVHPGLRVAPAGPQVGEHTDKVLAEWLGYDGPVRESLRDERAIA